MDRLMYEVYVAELNLLHAMEKLAEATLPRAAFNAIFRAPVEPQHNVHSHLRLALQEHGNPEMYDHLKKLIDQRYCVNRLRIVNGSRLGISRASQAAMNVADARAILAAAVRYSKKGVRLDYTPTVVCRTGEASNITEDGYGRVMLPIHWHLSVKRHGIALCKHGGDHVFVVRARPQPSAFLAEMGIRYFEVDGLRIGPFGRVTHGYVFVAKGCEPVFSTAFKTGVAEMKRRIAELAFSIMDG